MESTKSLRQNYRSACARGMCEYLRVHAYILVRVEKPHGNTVFRARRKCFPHSRTHVWFPLWVRSAVYVRVRDVKSEMTERASELAGD